MKTTSGSQWPSCLSQLSTFCCINRKVWVTRLSAIHFQSKHLKSSLKKDLYERIKLYELHLYREHYYIWFGTSWLTTSSVNTLTVYRLSRPSCGTYAYESILSFDLACPSGLISNSVPSQLKDLETIRVCTDDHNLLLLLLTCTL